MSVTVMFEDGPADGEEFELIGGLPPYLMLMRSPSGIFGEGDHVVVGAGFDDEWPDSHRYVLDLTQTELMIVGDRGPSGEAVYRYVERPS